MALVLEGEVATMDPQRPVVPAGRVYVDDQGRIAAVLGAGEPAPGGFDAAPRVRTGGVVYPGLIDPSSASMCPHRRRRAPCEQASTPG
jgi:imidazolonepropionase-like amidohydrolase